MSRKEKELYPDFTAFVKEIEDNGISEQLLQKIIKKHEPNAKYNRALYDRYKTTEEGVPIFKREPRFEEEKPINNKINNDFFSEIVDFKTGYFAGNPISYGYNKGDESEEVTGGKEAVDEATKAITDFTTRNNMFGVDMETTKFASIYGYAGRLFYIDPDGIERVMPIHGYETIILSNNSISEPKYAIRYFKTYDINDNETWIVEFYDNANIYTYRGTLSQLEFVDVKPHMFDYCPLQGIANNQEMLGDAEKVLAAIDAYDITISDNANELESFAHAYMIFENLRIDDEEIKKAQVSGSFKFNSTGTQQGKAYYLTKDINDGFTEHQLAHLEDNIHRFSKTPNLNDAAFGSASGVSLKFKLHGLETKCSMFEAKMMDAAQYMWRLLSASWEKRMGVKVDPLQIIMEFSRNFPLDLLSEAQTATSFKNLGMPMEWIVGQISSVDDPDYIMELIEQEKENSVPSLLDDLEKEEEQAQQKQKANNEE